MIRNILIVLLCIGIIHVNAKPFSSEENSSEEFGNAGQQADIIVIDIDGSHSDENNDNDYGIVKRSVFDENDGKINKTNTSNGTTDVLLVEDIVDIDLDDSVAVETIKFGASKTNDRVKKEITENDLNLSEINDSEEFLEDLDLQETHVFRPLFSYRAQIAQRRRIRQNAQTK